jgi:hypothetical protein
MQFTSTPTGNLIDQYGAADKIEKSAKKTKDEIKAVVIEREGEGKFEGAEFAGSCVHPVKSTIKWEAVALACAKKAGLTDKQLTAIIEANTGLADYWMLTVKPRVTLLS